MASQCGTQKQTGETILTFRRSARFVSVTGILKVWEKICSFSSYWETYLLSARSSV